MLELPVPEGRTIRVTYSAHVLSSVCKDHSVERQGSSEEVHPGSRVRTQASTLGVQPLRFKRSCIGCVIFYRDAANKGAQIRRDNLLYYISVVIELQSRVSNLESQGMTMLLPSSAAIIPRADVILVVMMAAFQDHR